MILLMCLLLFVSMTFEYFNLFHYLELLTEFKMSELQILINTGNEFMDYFLLFV